MTPTSPSPNTARLPIPIPIFPALYETGRRTERREELDYSRCFDGDARGQQLPLHYEGHVSGAHVPPGNEGKVSGEPGGLSMVEGKGEAE